MGNHDVWADTCLYAHCGNDRVKGAYFCDEHKITNERVDAAKAALIAEDEASLRRAREYAESAAHAENERKSNLPSEDPEHIHGMMCDGQDGDTSHCVRLRVKLFGTCWPLNR